MFAMKKRLKDAVSFSVFVFVIVAEVNIMIDRMMQDEK